MKQEGEAKEVTLSLKMADCDDVDKSSRYLIMNQVTAAMVILTGWYL